MCNKCNNTGWVRLEQFGDTGWDLCDCGVEECGTTTFVVQ